MKIDAPTLGYALLVETVLVGLAFFGGPHGYLGMLPWLIQLPGALLFFYGPPSVNKALMLALAFLIQVAIWYLIISALRAVRRRKRQ